MDAAMSPDLVRVALIGAGRIGCIHAGNLAFRIPGARLVAEAAAKAARDYGIPVAVEDYRPRLRASTSSASSPSTTTWRGATGPQ